MTTHILMIADMSGSMYELTEETITGFNTYLDGLARDGGDYAITAVLFDHEYMPLCVGAALGDVPRLDRTNYTPRGYTALLDAVGRTVGDFERRVPELADGDKVLLVIQTDGKENASKEFTFDSVKKLLDERTAEGGRWSVIYIGAGADTWDQASRMGVKAGQYVNTSGSKDATQSTYDSLTASTVAYAAGASADDATRIVRHATRGK